ncbi:uncharacterized protein ACHE_51242A [Aspergillus chevalieri]|uniref:Sulfite reductase beta subunit n=1 Tax=Aspergillus chevalieri TaxID=182096 RepID=A0A7R7VSM9_ASPCH|nr:uncharacterized protein ACHE_51242A [Aspergillus chevalieri]BCR90044.1 hypothetical protein ACHE_51242A [Aspergillus chevalieri]
MATDADSDPVVASYDVYLTDSEISRYVLQYLDRPANQAYDDRHGQKPTALRLKPQTGLVEVDVPISTRVNYDVGKGLRYGDAMKKSRSAREGGAYGMAGGFSGGSAGSGGGGKVKMEDGDVEMGGIKKGGDAEDTASLLRLQTLGGRKKTPEDGDPVYMLAAFRGKDLHLSPVSAVVQLHPQLHHLDALDEVPTKGRGKARKEGEDERAAESEARTIDVKIKAAAEDGEAAMVAGNLELLKKMQDEKWSTYDWVDAETEESWQTYEQCMVNQEIESLPQLQSVIDGEDYLDQMSAPRIDPAHPELTGWAMKQNRKKQHEDTPVTE